MITGSREPTGIELHMTRDEADIVRNSLHATGVLCFSLIASDLRGGRPPTGSLIDQLPNAVIHVLREQARAHFDLRDAIGAVQNQ